MRLARKINDQMRQRHVVIDYANAAEKTRRHRPPALPGNPAKTEAAREPRAPALPAATGREAIAHSVEKSPHK